MPWETTSENLPEPDILSPLKHMLSAHHILCQESALLGLLPQTAGRSHSQKHSRGHIHQSLSSRVIDKAKPKPDIWGEGGCLLTLQHQEERFLAKRKILLLRDLFSSSMLKGTQAPPTTVIKATWFSPHKTYLVAKKKI